MKKTLVIIALCLAATLVSVSFTQSKGAASIPSHGVVSIAFDDEMQSQYSYAFPLLQVRGIVGTFYVNTDNISDFSNDSSYMSIAELRNLQGNGSEIASHSKSHSNFLDLTDAQIQNECSIPKQILQSNGLEASNFAYPFGEMNAHIESIVARYYQSARLAYTPPYVMPLPTSQFILPGFGGETGDSSALPRLQNMVDQVYSAKGWVIIFFHDIIPNANTTLDMISTQDFAAFLDYTQAKGVQTLTVSQALNLAALSWPTPNPSPSTPPPPVPSPSPSPSSVSFAKSGSSFSSSVSFAESSSVSFAKSGSSFSSSVSFAESNCPYFAFA